MDITLNVPDADVDALSAQWANRVPLLTGPGATEDDPPVIIERTADHLTRTYALKLSEELAAGRITAADQVLAAATGDADRQAAWLVGDKLRRAP